MNRNIGNDAGVTESIENVPTFEEAFTFLQQTFQSVLASASDRLARFDDELRQVQGVTDKSEEFKDSLRQKFQKGVIESCQDFVNDNLLDINNGSLFTSEEAPLLNFVAGPAPPKWAQYGLMLLEAIDTVKGDASIKDALAASICEKYMIEYARDTHRIERLISKCLPSVQSIMKVDE